MVRASIGESLLQARALKRGAAHLVRVAARKLPVVLTTDVRAEAFCLGFERERLVLLVSRDPRVGRHTNGAALDRLMRLTHGDVLSRHWLKGNPLQAFAAIREHLGEDSDCAGELVI